MTLVVFVEIAVIHRLRILSISVGLPGMRFDGNIRINRGELHGDIALIIFLGQMIRSNHSKVCGFSRWRLSSSTIYISLFKCVRF